MKKSKAYFDDIVTECPCCGAMWGIDEMQLGRCFACGSREDDSIGYEDDLNDNEDYKMQTTNIEINGEKFVIEGDSLTYELIADLAGLDAQQNPSMTYKRGGGKKNEGILYHGESIVVQDGISISAYVTGNS